MRRRALFAASELFSSALLQHPQLRLYWLFGMQRQQAAHLQAVNAEQKQNFLKRETPFLCNVRFRCDLPEVSMLT